MLIGQSAATKKLSHYIFFTVPTNQRNLSGAEIVDLLKTVLIVGSGGREHAILKALLRSKSAVCAFAYPGNPGMENDGCMLVDVPIKTWDDLAAWAENNSVDLTIVGPEIPLTEGIVDVFSKRKLAIFGPSQKAAALEGSKAFAKNLMKKYAIPTASYEIFTDKKHAMAYLKKQGVPIVVKASGLAAGKGAMVCDTMAQAEDALTELFDKKIFGEAGTTVVLEEKMEGEEASVFALTDGKTYRILPVAQDHKRIGDNDTGPNTGGMGAYAPAPLIDKKILARIEKEVIVPTLAAMKKEGRLYKGLLYAGIMVTPIGPKVVEFNCRFGDPETQAVLPLCRCDWYDVFEACCKGHLADVSLKVSRDYCVAVVCASKGYPGKYATGKVIKGIDKADYRVSNVDIYHSGTVKNGDGQFVTSGGRVLAVSSWADTLEKAIKQAYGTLHKISFDGMVCRTDIGAKGVARISHKGGKHA